MTNENADTITLELIKEVQKRRQEIAEVSRPQWKTNCNFRFEGSDRSINLHVATDITTLVSMATHVLQLQDYFDKAVKVLDIKEDMFCEFCGSPTEAWLADIKLRISMVGLKKKKASLKKMEDRLDAIISPELRREMELEAIKAELNG